MDAVFGIRDEARRAKGGGSGANTVAIVYEPRLTLDLPRDESGGTAMNALAHCVEALYVSESPEAHQGAALIDEWLPRVLADGRDEEARRRLLEGAMDAGIALRDHGFYLGHAMAQALGGRYGLPHGALNAICLPAAMRFNGATQPFGIQRVEELAQALRLHAAARSRRPGERARRGRRSDRCPRRCPGEPASCVARTDRRAAADGLVAGISRNRRGRSPRPQPRFRAELRR